MVKNSFEKFLVYATKSGIFIILFLPLLITDSLYFPYITGKNFVFRIITEIIFIFYLVLIFKNKNYRPKFSYLSALIFLFVIANLISTIIGVNPYHSFWGNYERMLGFLGYIHLLLFFLIIIGIFKEEKEWQRIFKTSILVSVLVSIYAFAQKFALFGLVKPLRLDSTFGNPLYLGAFIILNIFLILYFLIKSSNWQKFFGWGFLFIFEIYILLGTLSRGPILAIVGGIILFLILILFTKENSDILNEKIKIQPLLSTKNLKIISATALGLIFLSLILIFSFKTSNFVQSNPYLYRLTNLSLKEETIAHRLLLQSIAFSGIKEKPLFGWGPENFFYLYHKHFNPKMNISDVFFDRAHNMIVDVAIESGFIGISIYLLIFIFAVFLIFKLIKKQKEKSLFYCAILATLFGYFIQNLSVFDNLTSFILFLIILGYLEFNFKNLYNQRLETSEIKLKKFDNKRTDPGAQIALLIILIIPAIYFISFLNIKPMIAAKSTISAYKAPSISQALNLFKKAVNLNTFGNSEIGIAAGDYYLRINQQKEAQNELVKIKNDFENFIINTLETNIKKNPQDFKNLLMLYKIHQFRSEYDKSLEILNKILTLNPKKQETYNQIAQIYVLKKDYKTAINLLKTAVDLLPSNRKVHFNLIMTYLMNGDLDKAKQQFKIIQDMIPQIAKNEKEKINLLTENLNQVAKIYNNYGYSNLAIENLEELINLDPNNSDAYFNLAYLYKQTNQKQKALDILNALLKQDRSQKEKINQFIQQFQLLK